VFSSGIYNPFRVDMSDSVRYINKLAEIILKIYKMNKKIIFSIFLIVCINNNRIYSQWIQQTSPTTSKLEALYFLDSNTGFTSSSSVSQMYKTTNGGQTWSVIGNYPARDIWFADINTGYATAAAGSPNGTMKKTTNAGISWSQITPPNSSAYLGVFATAPTTAYFINTEDKVLRTTNSGASLTSYTIPLANSASSSLKDIFFINLNTGFICADSGKIFKTTNGGTTWDDLLINNFTTLNSIYFVNFNVGYSAGSKVLKTIDGGTTWIDKSIGGAFSAINAIKFYDENNGLAVCLSGKIFRTNNGGDTWIPEVSGTTSHLWNVFYLSSTSAIIVGDNGTILKNSNLLSVNDYTIHKNFELYPNPIKDYSIISIDNYDSYESLELELYNLRGQLLKKDFIKSNKYLLNKIVELSEYFLYI
jgi:photosystem II stability/assembly factor-like uncharacterized protein